MDTYYLAVDIGGTKISGALFNASGGIVDDYVYTAASQTFMGEEGIYRNVAAALRQVMDHFKLGPDQILGIGVGSPGPLDARRGIIVHAPLLGWRNFPLAHRLREDFSLPVCLDNDGNLGALAEQRRGVVRGLQNIVYITVSTGCGGGIIINGEMYHGAHDGAGEVGHMSIDPEGPECPCGSRGCFELYASGTSLVSAMRRDMGEGKKTSRVFELAQGKAEKLNGRLLDQAAEEGDEYALELYRREGYYLGVGISNIFNLYDPEALVLGGGVIRAKDFFGPALLETLQERCIHPIHQDSIRYSEMNDRVVLYGAFFLIKEYLEKNNKKYTPTQDR